MDSDGYLLHEVVEVLLDSMSRVQVTPVVVTQVNLQDFYDSFSGLYMTANTSSEHM